MRIAIFLSLLLLTASCRKNDPLIVANIDDEVRFRLLEVPGPAPRALILQGETIEKYECKNYQITFEVFPHAKDYAVNLTGIALQGPCVDVSGSAACTIPFGPFQEDSYEVHLNLRNAIFNSGRLLEQAGAYQLLMKTDYGIDIPKPLLSKLPDDVCWGTISYADPQQSGQALEAIAQLDQAGFSEVPAYGNYGHFEVSEQGVSIQPPLSGMALYRPFAFHHGGRLPELQAVLDQARTQYPGLSFTCLAATGESL